MTIDTYVKNEEKIKKLTDTFLKDIRDPEAAKKVSNFFLKDVSEYIKKIIEFAEHISEESKHSNELQKELEKLNTEFLLRAHDLDLSLSNKTIIRKVKENFRELVGDWAYQSLIVKRCFEKPRGYPGDYMMIENVYNNRPLSKGMGEYFDRYLLSNAYTIAVRLRKNKLGEILHNYIAGNVNKPEIRILNLACGSCREIVELIPQIKYKNPLIFTCIDWDEEALDFSRNALRNPPENIKTDFIKKDLMNLTKEEDSGFLPKQDLIYSIGLIDYLPNRILKKWLQTFYAFLPSGGKFIVTHKDKEKTFPPLPPDWFCDWKFVPRTKDEAVELLQNTLSSFDLDIKTDDFSYIFYFTLTKR